MDIHCKYFIQYMLKNGVSTVNDALNYYKHVSKENVDNITKLKAAIREINGQISKQSYKIVFTVCEVTNENLVVWLNTKDDNISKLQVAYSPIELEYFNTLLQEIITSESHRLTFIVCLNITSTLTAKLSRDSGQRVLGRWVKGGYYVKRGDFIHLGPRTILEYTAYLRLRCPESLCNLCSELVFTGKRCYHCDKLLHSYCLSTYLSNQTVCPYCKNEWVYDDEDLVNTVVIDNTDGLFTEEQSVSTPSRDLSPVPGTSRSVDNLSTNSEHSVSDTYKSSIKQKSKKRAKTRHS